MGTDEALKEGLETQEAVVSDEALGAMETVALKEGQEAAEAEALDKALETDDAVEEAKTQGRVDLRSMRGCLQLMRQRWTKRLTARLAMNPA